MMGQRSSQRSPLDAEYHFKHLVGENCFPWQLSQVRDELFRDEEFSELYRLDNGRPSVPSSLLATALLLQTHDKVSDTEAHRRAEQEDYERYLEPSLKGSVDVDWSATEARRGFLAEIVADAERLQSQALTLPQSADNRDPAQPRIRDAAGLLCKLLLQDVERQPDGVAVREG